MGGVVRHKWNKVLSNDFDLVVVNTGKQYTFCAGVDEAQEMLLARLDSEHGEASIGSAGAVNWRGGVVGNGAAVVIGFTVDELKDWF